jgi:hypothetical protein
MFGWQRLGTIATSTQLGGIAAAPSGYVVLEFPRTVWFSPDGRAWTKSTLPFKSGTSNGVRLRAWANEVAGGPGGFVVVGGNHQAPCTENTGVGGPPPCAVAPISWASSDGLTWRSSQSTLIPADGSALPDDSELVRAWPADDGWDASVEARDSVLYHGNKLLHSPDGLVWARTKAAPVPEGASSGDDIFSHAGVATSSGLRLLWQVRTVVVPTESWLSFMADGAGWTDVPGFDGTGAFVSVGLAPEDDSTGPWLILGTWFNGESHPLTSWFSQDLTTWKSGHLSTAGGLAIGGSVLEHWADGYIAVGVEEDEHELPVTWLSADGTTWSTVVGPEPAPLDGPVFLTSGPAGLIGIGSREGSTAWLGVNLAD